MRKIVFRRKVCAVWLGLALAAGVCGAQEIAGATLPDAPFPAISAALGAGSDGAAGAAFGGWAPPAGKSEGVPLSFIPNFQPLSASLHLPPQTVKEKFLAATETNVEFLAFVNPAISAAYRYGTDATPEFGKGGTGYGRYYWHSLVDRTSEDYCVGFIVPALLHEDTRYYTLGKEGGGGWARTRYALTRVAVTRSDAGNPTLNLGEIVGSGMAGGLANLYYPRSERTFSDVGQRWGTNIGVDAVAFLIQEFWPDVSHAVFHRKVDSK